ncbi:MarR family winged helix-turn-helix transcriptional regulator [Pacificimonas sp. ICDLI1SI03]|jgi:DNA-binding MarR family transcriptional regulator|tara:strand:+ start:149003 stop:149509 length:507 start_codon:yes stop_codon:yes gene_type:complete
MAKATQNKAPASTHSILHLVKQVQYKAYVRLEDVFQPLGITAVQFRLLTTLSTMPGTSSAELARLYDVKPQTMIKQIAMLENKELIERRVSDTNKRRLELRLTQAGADTLAECRRDSRAIERDILKILSAEEQRDLRRSLTRLLNSLEDSAKPEEFTPEYSRPGVQRG